MNKNLRITVFLLLAKNFELLGFLYYVFANGLTEGMDNYLANIYSEQVNKAYLDIILKIVSFV